eukprot:CAMPEP_0117058878 /NCGR_PEP_ID=MMETSP0472-20121206/40893_1 /TAXON_ID=693140 ORGANISM="Tiarina fusus, Strain LIS" /NCGR_SAMPLE_ID=MMETSP0472 /ASSEMBLY_ACC=CAM_ASM_000603 /LENGTH=805 /DNA_ID=CAMNT_0004776357 /DNA_START=1 /DNA_END=2418 /DNA_ORIENTATION=+
MQAQNSMAQDMLFPEGTTDPPEQQEQHATVIMYGNDPATISASTRDFSVGSAPSEYDPETAPASAKQRAAKEERNRLGKRETTAILCLRIVVLSLLIVLAASTSASIYFWVQASDFEAFVSGFDFYSKLVQERFNNAIERKLSAVDSLSVIYTSHALQTGDRFPFVTVPDFEYKGSNARITGDTVMTFYLPYITNETRVAWEEYTQDNGSYLVQSWREEQRQKRIQDAKYGLETPELTGFGQEALDSGVLSDGERRPPGHIWFADGNNSGMERDETLEAPYFPVWQMTPLLPPEVDLVNLDMSKYEFLSGALSNTLATGEASLDIVTDLVTSAEGEDSDAAVFDLLIQSGQYRHQTEHYEGDPLSSLIYPVFDNFGRNKAVVGVFFSTLYWRFLLSDILPEGIVGMVCVLENSFGQLYSYVINGDEAVFLGQGDLHDGLYDDIGMEVTIDIAKHLERASQPETRTFTSVDLNDDYLNYKLHVYPSEAFEAIYSTGEAQTDAVGVGVIFAVVIAIFVVYDCCVQRRQRIVMDRAVKATAVVSSLYPETVREQIINDGGNDVVNKSRQIAFTRKAVEKRNGGCAPPIATKHPNCTVYFADLAGFTKWSSSREPEQVFQLLEALFKEFDAAALRRGVFKVETIGDCYMAVTGLPMEQEDHAIRMAKFANDCQHKLEQITAELTATLGEGTDDLALRTGMHSGEVTAGVLRGEKGRFQLFGDTVNTASRMESNGIPRKIQVSQTTADALILEGKESWLIPRKEKVVAKGKGEMQTYFLHVKDKSQSASNSSATMSLNGSKLELSHRGLH